MKSLSDLSDREIDALLMKLFGIESDDHHALKKNNLSQKSENDLKKMRSRNHPDKSPQANIELYREVTYELLKRREWEKSNND